MRIYRVLPAFATASGHSPLLIAEPQLRLSSALRTIPQTHDVSRSVSRWPPHGNSIVNLRRIFVLLFLVSVPAAAQDQPESADTSRWNGVVLLDPGIALGRPTLIFPPAFRPETQGGSSLLLQPYPGLGPDLFDAHAFPKADLLSPYLLALQREKKRSTFYTVLGAMELSAVAYVAYRHVRRFGF